MDKLEKIKKYLTSYESISTIMGLNYFMSNKGLDEKTMKEMVRRYMIVHDKILKIIEEANDEK